MKAVKLTPPQQRLLDKMSKEEHGFTMRGHSNPEVKFNLFADHREEIVADNLVKKGILKIEYTDSLWGDWHNDWIISVNK